MNTILQVSLLQIITQIGSYSLTVTDQKRQALSSSPRCRSYSLKERISIRAADTGCFIFASGYLESSTRFEVRGIEHFEAIEAAGQIADIYVLARPDTVRVPSIFGTAASLCMTSQSFDGEYIARFIQRFGYGAIRGSSSRGGARALSRDDQVHESRPPDGIRRRWPPRPALRGEAGPVILAKKTRQSHDSVCL